MKGWNRMRSKKGWPRGRLLFRPTLEKRRPVRRCRSGVDDQGQRQYRDLFRSGGSGPGTTKAEYLCGSQGRYGHGLKHGGGPEGDPPDPDRPFSSLPVGTVPIYQAVVETVREKGGIIHLTADKIFEVIEGQAQAGVDFITVHCGVTLNSLERLQKQGRITDIVSRGGAFLATWMVYHEKENPLYTQYDRLIELARKYDLTLSLGDGLRPGCLADATDRAQVQELIHLGELREQALSAGVQVMIEGPGHVPLNQIEANILLQKQLCQGAPFYVLGPLVTDIAAGYDHIACAIGGALAGMAGADFLCYVTPSEHLKLPTPEDVREGIIATRIAAHAADLARGQAKAWEQDRQMALARKALNWERQISLCLDPEKARRIRAES